jgi:ribosome biogenesis GTPase
MTIHWPIFYFVNTTALGKKAMNSKQKLVERHEKATQKQSRKQKLREARRKTGRNDHPHKPRLKKIAIDDWNNLDELELDNFSPIMPLGSREQRRETEKMATHEGITAPAPNKRTQALTEDGQADPVAAIRCLVVEVGPSMCQVDYKGQRLLCVLRGNIKDASTKYVNPVAVGDWVFVNQLESGRGVVESVLPRRSVLTRPYSPDQGKLIEDLFQIVVANVDRLLIVASWREPYLWPALIDRYLISAQRNHIEAVICINKVDLVDDWEAFHEIVQVYESLGLKLILTSAVTLQGIDALKKHLQSGTTVLAGLSGVGKSSLLTAVQPDLDLKVGEVSESGLFTGQGRHTTTQSSLWQLTSGGVVIDTPGVRSFAIAGIQPVSLGSWYPEMVPLLKDCRFRNCTHLNEPGCAVKAAVENGLVSRLRYNNYIQLYEELSSF